MKNKEGGRGSEGKGRREREGGRERRKTSYKIHSSAFVHEKYHHFHYFYCKWCFLMLSTK